MRNEPRKYDEEAELGRYLCRHYPGAFTARESELISAAESEINARFLEQMTTETLRHTPGDPLYEDVMIIMELGYEVYLAQCCQRALARHPKEIFINRCERCQKIVNSPVACLCMWCGHTWYERRAELIELARSPLYQPSTH